MQTNHGVVMGDLVKYHKIITQEIVLLKDKLKCLTNHPAENGRIREIILLNIIRKHLPQKYSIGPGFIIKQIAERGKCITSTQVDLMVYDNSYPIMFKEGDFTIITNDAVRAIIEVKTALNRTSFSEAYNKANEMGRFILENTPNIHRSFSLFNGIFYFNNSRVTYQEELIQREIQNAHNETNRNEQFPYFCVNHICLSSNVMYKYWMINNQGTKHKLYQLEDLAYSFFISNLLNYLEDRTIADNKFLWYPDDKTFRCYKQF